MEAFELTNLIDQQNETWQDYLEFLRVPALSAGLYMLAAGTLVYVKANVEHRFHTITEDLRVLVFFAPAEYTAAQS
ncbi:MAG TPA: hypothetical protein VF844_11230 [Ktedonobacteraceae bacterium]